MKFGAWKTEKNCEMAPINFERQAGVFRVESQTQTVGMGLLPAGTFKWRKYNGGQGKIP